MKINLEPDEVRAAIRHYADMIVLPSRVGEAGAVVIHKNGSATIEFDDDPFEGNAFEGLPA